MLRKSRLFFQISRQIFSVIFADFLAGRKAQNSLEFRDHILEFNIKWVYNVG
jgi:hypothetical protein